MDAPLKTLCLAAGLPCEDDVTDLVCFQIDEKLLLMLSHDAVTGLLSLECDVAQIAPEDNAEACRLIATANYRFLQTDGSTLGLDPVTGGVILCRRVPMLSLDETSFPVLVTRFLDVAERWQGRLSRLTAERNADVAKDAAASGDDFTDFLNVRA